MTTPDVQAITDLVRRLAQVLDDGGATAGDVAALAGGPVTDDGAPLGVRAETDVEGVEAVTVSRVWDSDEANAVEIALAPGLRVEQLEAEFGPGRPRPTPRPGDRRVVLGGDGLAGGVLAAVDETGGVRSITVRPDGS